MAEKEKTAASAKNNKPGFWQGVKHEWKKIIWPKKEDLTKQTILVVVLSLLLGVIITVVDSGALRLIDWILSI
jgi:preprotein translocase subunit SecE